MTISHHHFPLIIAISLIVYFGLIINQVSAQTNNSSNIVTSSGSTSNKSASIPITTSQLAGLSNSNVTPGFAYLKVITKFDNPCIQSNNSNTNCKPVDEFYFGSSVYALQFDNNVKVISHIPGNSFGWKLTFLPDNVNGLQYIVRPDFDSIGGLNSPPQWTSEKSTDCHGILMNGDNKTCTITYKKPLIS